MGNYTIFLDVQKSLGRQARNLTTNVPKILDLKSSYEQIFSKNWHWVPLNIGSKIELLNNPPYLKAFFYPRILENTCLSAKKKIEEIYVLKSASFFVIDCYFRFQRVLLSFYNLGSHQLSRKAKGFYFFCLCLLRGGKKIPNATKASPKKWK